MVLPSPLEAVDLSVASQVAVISEPVRMRTPRAGWAVLTMRVTLTGASGRPTLRLPAFARGPAVSAVAAYQVLSAPVDYDTAAYIRQSGGTGGIRSVPRVLLPLALNRDGSIDLTTARDTDHPTAPPPRLTRGPVLVWIEVRAANSAPAVDTAGTCDLLDGSGGDVLGSVPVTLSVADLSLPDANHLRITAPLDWSAVAAARPAAFAGVVPRLLSRHEPASAAAVGVLDAYVRLAHDNRLGVFVPQLQPIVKWPVGRPPAVDWTDFDGVAGPWLSGSAFADGQPVGFWPLPTPDALDDFDLAARSQYRGLAAEHFDRQRWLGGPCPVVLRADTAGPVTEAGAILLSAEARATLDAAPAVRAMLPLRDDQLPLASASNPSLVSAATATRLLTRAAGDVRIAGASAWPAGTLPPGQYMDATDAEVLHGSGDEQDVRATAWLAFLRDATVLACGPASPSTAAPPDPTGANEMPWFYPGLRYAADGPLPTLQLKWLRQAEQDYEVLAMATASGDRNAALALCRSIAKPVNVSPGPVPSEVSLLGGTTDPHACEDARDLLMDRLASRRSHVKPDTGVTRLDLRTVRWFNAHQRPTAFATGVQWTWGNRAADPPDAGPGRWITAGVSVGVYDPADPAAADEPTGDPSVSDGSTLTFQTTGAWEPHPPATDVPAIPAGGVRTAMAVARFNLDQAPSSPLAPDGQPPVRLSLIDPADGQTVDCPLVLPVASCDRLTRPVTLDGNLDDWFASDAALLDRPLERMSNRPAMQAGVARPAERPSSLYTGWSDEDLYVAFRVAGVTSDGVRAARNFVQYREGRAWGEDLCEMTVQPIYVDDTLGPTLHVVCKPGGEWVERQPPTGGDWQPFEGAALRYASTVDPGTTTWRGELAIPWQSLVLPGRGRPALLRFNIGQHVNATGESATWAAPVDQSRQSGMAGLLVLRDTAK